MKISCLLFLPALIVAGAGSVSAETPAPAPQPGVLTVEHLNSAAASRAAAAIGRKAAEGNIAVAGGQNPLCLSMRTYLFEHDDAVQGGAKLKGYSTCSPASDFKVQSVDSTSK